VLHTILVDHHSRTSGNGSDLFPHPSGTSATYSVCGAYSHDMTNPRIRGGTGGSDRTADHGAVIAVLTAAIVLIGKKEGET
jgi:hypothetical protein